MARKMAPYRMATKMATHKIATKMSRNMAPYRMARNMAPKKNAKFCNGVRVLYKALSVLLALLRELPFISYLGVLIVSIFGQN